MQVARKKVIPKPSNSNPKPSKTYAETNKNHKCQGCAPERTSMRSKWNPGYKPTPVGWIPCPVQNRKSILANPESILADRGFILANPESIPADPKWHEMHGIPMKTYRPGQPGNHPSAPKRHPGQPEGFVAWAPNGRAPYRPRTGDARPCRTYVRPCRTYARP